MTSPQTDPLLQDFSRRTFTSLDYLDGLFRRCRTDSVGTTVASLANGGPAHEFSIVLSPLKPDVRVFYRPATGQRRDSSPVASWNRGWELLADNASDDRYSVRSVLGHAHRVRDLFEPSHPDAAFGLCLAVSTEPSNAPKIYFDLHASGRERNPEVVGQALHRLGYGQVWEWLRANEFAATRWLMPAFFSLDLSNHRQSRAKVYTTVAETTIASLEHRCSPLPGYEFGRVADFVQTFTAGRASALALPKPRPTLCWSMTPDHADRPNDATLYVPFNSYVKDAVTAGEILDTVVSPVHRRGIKSLLEGTPDDANPFHWASIKLGMGYDTLTLYLSPSRVSF